MTFLKIASLLYVFFYYGILLAFRAFLLYRNTGINPIKNLEKKGIAGFVEKGITICFILVSVIAFNYVFLEYNYQFYLIPITYLEIQWIWITGIVLAFVGLIIGFVAQLQMGNSWRLGLNRKEKTDLITKGLYQYSRNPVYLGLMISYIGFFLMLPNALSFCWLVLSYFLLGVKIRLEEQYLESKHNPQFAIYKEKVRRWI